MAIGIEWQAAEKLPRSPSTGSGRTERALIETIEKISFMLRVSKRELPFTIRFQSEFELASDFAT